jgi:alkylation response protein AidB-like acyl-CoA dehydrogenase
VERVAPQASEIDRANSWPRALWDEVQALGITGVAFPEAVGGGGGTFLDYVLMIEELARASAAVALLPAVNVIAAAAIERYGSQVVKERYLSKVVSGELKACWAFTEPGTGSDPKALCTLAIEEDGAWVLRGAKAFISHSSVADVAVVFCRTGDRISAILVETDQPGFQPGSRCDLLGLRGADTGDIILDGARAPIDNLIGAVGDGMKVLVSVESEAKIRAAAMCVGMAQASLDASLSYGLQRMHRDVPIAVKFPTVQSLLADIAAAVESARWLTYRAATVRDLPGQPSLERVAATAKLVASQAGVRAANLAMQVHGAYGYTNDFEVSRIFRDVKAYEMIQGTAEIQRVIVAKSLLREAGLPRD